MIEKLKEIQNELKTQDNRSTADPIFLVQEKERVYGMDTEYAPETCYYDSENYCEISEEEYEALDGEGSVDYIGFFDQWRIIQPFFTEKAAQQYIDGNYYRHKGELRIYADSLYRNSEMKMIRDYILNLE